MKRYIVEIDGMNQFESTSCDAKKHLRDHGGNKCSVFYKDQKVSEARNGPEFGIHSVTI